MKLENAIVVCLLILSVSSVCQSAPDNKINWNACARYYYYSQTGNVPPQNTKGMWKLIDHKNGKGMQIENWNVTGYAPPTKQWLKDNNAAAISWYKNEQAVIDSDYTKWTARERAMIDVFRKLVKPEKTEAEMIDLIETELNNQ